MAAEFCIICEETSSPLKCFASENLKTAKASAVRRQSLKVNKFAHATDVLLHASLDTQPKYHSRCLSNFNAVKKIKDASPSGDDEPPRKVTRSSSVVPCTNRKGVLKKECIFCGRVRKRKGHLPVFDNGWKQFYSSSSHRQS